MSATDPGYPAPPGPPPRPRAARSAIAVVVVVDILIGVGTAFAVYYSTRRFGPPTAPLSIQAVAETCVPDACEEVASTVTVTWSPPEAGGDVLRYVIFRDGAEFERLAPDALRFVDDDVTPGERRRYEVQAVGDEGRGPRSVEVSAEVPLPPRAAARLNGEYRVAITFTEIGLLSRYEGVRNPSAGDRTTQDWILIADCPSSQGACDVRVSGGGVLRLRGGGTYAGEVPTEARCAGETVDSTTTLELRVIDVEMVDGVFTVTRFDGTNAVDFRCGREEVHAASNVTGALT